MSFHTHLSMSRSRGIHLLSFSLPFTTSPSLGWSYGPCSFLPVHSFCLFCKLFEHFASNSFKINEKPKQNSSIHFSTKWNEAKCHSNRRKRMHVTYGNTLAKVKWWQLLGIVVWNLRLWCRRKKFGISQFSCRIGISELFALFECLLHLPLNCNSNYNLNNIWQKR